MSQKQAEKEAAIYIEDHKQKNSWGAYIPTSIFTASYWTGARNPQPAAADSMDEQMQK